ncbi:hypothetical protein ABIF81_006036 [Bradyrhizobium daqingense]
MYRPSRPTKRGDLEVVLIASRACGGRGSVGMRLGRAGRVVPVSPTPACGRAALFSSSRRHFDGDVHNAVEPCGADECAYGKTVWSWPSLLRSSLSRRCERAQPGRLHQIAGRGRPEGTRLPGEHGISRPTIAQGRPSDRHHLYAAVRFFLRVHFAQQTAGACRHPAFPAPSSRKRVKETGKTRALPAARTLRHVWTSE